MNFPLVGNLRVLAALRLGDIKKKEVKSLGFLYAFITA